MNVPSESELYHYRLQSALRENNFKDDQLKYLGVRDGKHLYLIGGEHEVFADQLTGFEVEDD